MGYLLHTIAGALAATQPEAAAMIQGAAEAFVAELPILRPFSLIVTETLGEERARELRARGARMDWTKPSPTPLPRPPKPSTNSNPRPSHEQVAPVDTSQERPVGSTPSSCRRVLSANRTLTRRA
jgi:hypothetical protein